MRATRNLKIKIKEGSIYVILESTRDVSSAGLEHCLDKAGVAGSSPVHPTQYTFKQTKFFQPDIVSYLRWLCSKPEY